IVHSSLNARNVLSVVARTIAPKLFREHIAKGQTSNLHFGLQKVQHSQVAPVLCFLKVGNGDGYIELLPIILRGRQLIGGSHLQNIIPTEATTSLVLSVNQRLYELFASGCGLSLTGKVPQGRKVVKHIISKRLHVVLASGGS